MHRIPLLWIAFLVTLTSPMVYSQKKVTLEIQHLLNGQPFAYEQKAKNDLGFEVKITRLDYLISNITLYHDGNQTTFLDSTYFLVRNGEPFAVNLGTLSIGTLDSISFLAGVDSLNNHADPALWPAGHALAPTWPDMHWGWQAGYRFVAIEGNNGPDLFYHFELHPLGDPLVRKVTIATAGIKTDTGLAIRLTAECSNILSNINMSKVVFDHGSGKEAIGVMNNMQRKVFKPAGTISGLATYTPEVLRVGPNPTTDGHIRIFTGTHEGKGLTLYLTDTAGKQLLQQPVVSASTDITLPEKGVYVAEIRDTTGRLIAHNTLIFP